MNTLHVDSRRMRNNREQSQNRQTGQPNTIIRIIKGSRQWCV